MTIRPLLVFGRCAAVALTLAAAMSHVQAADAQDLGERVPDAQAIKDGLFPEDDCKALEAAGYKCMGFKAAIRYALPATAFRLGSADLPDVLRRQLDVFASVLSGRTSSAKGKVIRIEGHADASGSADANLSLSQKRAEAVKSYLVEKGADPGMLDAVGMGAKAPKAGTDPFSPANRRVEIGRLAD